MRMDVNNSSTSNAVMKRMRHPTRPPLPRSVRDVMIDYILEEREPTNTSSWPKWLGALSKTEFPSFVKGISYRKRFVNWISLLDVEEIEGKHVLCVKETRKTVPCVEELPRIIRAAHRGTGEFATPSSKPEDGQQSNSSGSQSKHNSIEECMRLIKKNYAFGNKQFGIRRGHVYREVLRCPECFSSGKLKIPGKDILDEVEDIDPDFGNEMNSITLQDAPSCMAINGPTNHSVWYDQQGIATEDSLYNKLLGVIKEIRIELGQTVQADSTAQDRLLTKLCCAEKLVKNLKEEAEPVFTFKVPSESFLKDFKVLTDGYVNAGNLALFLYDTNLLANIYRNYNATEYIDNINQCFEKLTQQEDMKLQVDNTSKGMVLTGGKRETSLK